MKTHFDIQFLENATETLRSIAHPIRIAIIHMLHEHKKLSVSDIHDKLDIEQAVASHHLRILKNKKVVTVHRSGNRSFYSLHNSDYHKIIQLLVKNL